MNFEHKSFGEGNQDKLCVRVDSDTGLEVHLILCPDNALNGESPVFECIDPQTVYVLISYEYIDNAVSQATDDLEYHFQLGLVIGDMTRRGVYYAENKLQK